MFRRLGGSLGGFGERRTRAQTLAEHESALQELTTDLRGSKTSAHVPSFFVARKPSMAFAKPPPLDSCSSVRVADLEPGWTHSGSVLRGRLVTHAIKMQSVQSVLEDEAGDVVTLHIYNVPSLPAYTTTLGDLQAAQALFPQGQRLAVVEPFFKIMLDGTHGVRVDNPAEVLFLDDDGHPTGSAAALAGGARGPPGPKTNRRYTSKKKTPGKQQRKRR